MTFYVRENKKINLKKIVLKDISNRFRKRRHIYVTEFDKNIV